MRDVTLQYKDERIYKAGGFLISSDKHAYQCQECGAIFQSKNKDYRSIFATDDRRCDKCNHSSDALKRVCDCKPIVGGSDGAAGWSE